MGQTLAVALAYESKTASMMLSNRILSPKIAGRFVVVATARTTLNAWRPLLARSRLVDDLTLAARSNLVEMLRNSVAHGNVAFESDSRDPHAEMIVFTNFPKGSDVPDWSGRIGGDGLL